MEFNFVGETMIEAFEFQEGDRKFACQVEGPRAARPQAWWWFTVSGDACRYAPFPAATDDTPESVRARVVAYYEELLTRRAAPLAPRGQWGRRGNRPQPAESGAQPAPPASPAQGSAAT